MADIFVKINGIAGESMDQSHHGEIEVSSGRLKIMQQSSMMSGSGDGAGKATVNDLLFVHQIDRASPNLMRHCLSGRHIPEVILTVRKAGGTPLDFLRITMNDVVIAVGGPSRTPGITRADQSLRERSRTRGRACAIGARSNAASL